MGKTAKQCRLGLFRESDFAGDLEDSKSTSGGTLCVFGSHTFVPVSWMCKKQTAVSHSSTESEIISLDTGLRLDGLPSLEPWDLIVSVLGNVSRVSHFHDVHGKDEFLQAVQVLAPRFKFFDTFIPDNENARGSSTCIHKDLLREDSIETHMITHEGRDHIVNMTSGRKRLVIVNVHYEPELILRRSRGKLRFIAPHWPSYPNVVGINQ